MIAVVKAAVRAIEPAVRWRRRLGAEKPLGLLSPGVSCSSSSNWNCHYASRSRNGAPIPDCKRRESLNHDVPCCYLDSRTRITIRTTATTTTTSRPLPLPSAVDNENDKDTIVIKAAASPAAGAAASTPTPIPIPNVTAVVVSASQSKIRHQINGDEASSIPMANDVTESVPTTTHTNRSRSESKTKPLSLQRVYRYLQLATFTEQEFNLAFDRIRQHLERSTAGDSDKSNSCGLSDSINLLQIQQYIEHQIVRQQGTTATTTTSSSTQSQDDEQLQLIQDYCRMEAKRFLQVFLQELRDSRKTLKKLRSSSSSQPPLPLEDSLTRQDFVHVLSKVTSRVDIRRTWPITFSMLLVGASVGVISPAMPFVVENLQLTAGQYGSVVSAFALAKMAGNIPSAIAVERHGRKPYMTVSLVVIAAGVGGIGLATTFEELYVCRLLTGMGVAALSTAGTMMMTDLSTPRNRASTFAPIMSAFAAGTALGPALGGYLVDQVGLNPTFYLVGVSYLGVAALNRTILEETSPNRQFFRRKPTLNASSSSSVPPPSSSSSDRQQASDTNSMKQQPAPPSLTSEVRNALRQWIPLAEDPKIRNVLIMSGLYWVSLAGSQMTLLPLLLTDQTGLAMSATQVGQVYMGMSMIQIIGNPIFAKIADRIGQVPAIVGGCTFIASAMAALPYTCSNAAAAAAVATTAAGTPDLAMYYLAANIGVWSIGSSMLSTAPVAYISDRVDASQRAQAIAMLRTCGDIGFWLGATSIGALADYTGSLDMAMQSSAALLFMATTWFATRQQLMFWAATTTKLEPAAAATEAPTTTITYAGAKNKV